MKAYLILELIAFSILFMVSLVLLNMLVNMICSLDNVCELKEVKEAIILLYIALILLLLGVTVYFMFIMLEIKTTEK